jgi:hypothetical protein
MSLSAPRAIYGVHSASPYRRTDGTFYGIMKVLKGSSLSLQGTLNKLLGGSSKYPWAVEEGEVNAEIALKISEYPDFLFELFLGKAPTVSAADAAGTASTLTNKQGASVQSATTGIASATVLAGSKTDLKFAKYVVKCVTPTTVDVYASTDADFSKGTAVTYQDDFLKITATPLTIVASAPVTVPGTGIQLTGGSGTIGMTAGDTATFEVKPTSSKSMAVSIGAAADVFPEFGMIMMAKKRGNNELFEVDAVRCKGAGLPIGLAMNAWSEADVKAEAFYDSALDCVLKVRTIGET